MKGKTSLGQGDFLLRFLHGYLWLTALLLAVMGGILVFVTRGEGKTLPKPDALFGISNRTLLAIAGLAHIVISVYLFATRELITRGMMIVWVGMVHYVYWLEISWLTTARPIPVLRILAARLDIAPKDLNRYWKYLMAFLIIGGLAEILIVWKRMKRLDSEDFKRRWYKLREQQKSPSQPRAKRD